MPAPISPPKPSRATADGHACRSACLLPLLLICMMVVPSTLPAQQGALRGIVLDAESGSPIDDAYLFIHPEKKAEQGLDRSTDDEGDFLFSPLASGTYLLLVSRAGYRAQRMNIDIPAHEERDLIVYLHPRTYQTAPVVVTGTHMHTRLEHADEVATVLRGKELDRELGLTLAATLKNETGLAMRAMGPAPARPVIRGLGGDRVLLSEDGNKTTDLSASSPDHAVTIEPFAAERIEVLRGPKVLTQSPVTIGGVVNVVRHDVPQDMHEKVLGRLGLYGESANGGALGSFSAELPLQPVMLRGEITHRSSGDLRTPEGRLRNSASTSTDLGFGGSVIDENGYAGLSFRRFALEYGVPGGFVGAHPDGVQIELERRQYNVRASHAVDAAWLHDVTVQLSRAYYRHREFEASGRIGSEFRIVSYPGKIWLSHHSVGPIDEGIAGVSFEYRDFSVGGFVFTAPSTSFNLSPYLFERFSIGPVQVDAAARYNYDRITPRDENAEARIGHIRTREFHTWSLSATALYELTDIVHIGANVSRSSRVPTIEELFSEGPHLAAYSYEVGNPDLVDENGIGTEFFLYHRFPSVYFNLTFFRNDMHAFIIPRNTGTLNYATFLPVYATSSVEALLYGTEMQVEWDAADAVTLDASLSYTHGSFRDTGSPLPQIPPLKGQLGVTWKAAPWRIGMRGEFADRQSRVDDFEEATAGFALLHGFAQYSFTTGQQVHNLSLSAENLLDQSHRNHLSRVKTILPEAGRNLRLTYKLHFEI
ncbi:MAG: TonB-dependent receptor [Bacteroidota bacterium]|nr:TonB-dependent receptor [Bacteroidota bacterium]